MAAIEKLDTYHKALILSTYINQCLPNLAKQFQRAAARESWGMMWSCFSFSPREITCLPSAVR